MGKRVSFVVVGLLLCGSALAQWTAQSSGTDASLRGLSVVSPAVAWASGTGGTFLRTTDGGTTWQKGTVPGAEKLDFRDVEAFDARTAYLLSIGPGENSRIYKTSDGGQTWSLQFTNSNPKGFFDCMAFRDAHHGMAVGDPVDGHFELIETADGGAHWTAVDPVRLPPALAGEGSFAASGTCIAVSGKKSAWFITGGTGGARVIRTDDGGKKWTAQTTPIVSGTDGAGIFSVGFADEQRGVIVGGDYKNPAAAGNNSAFTYDRGKTWTLSPKPLSGFRSAVAIVPDTPGPTAIAVGTSGTDYSLDHGRTWTHYTEDALNAVAFADPHSGWAVGPKGRILKFEGTVPGGSAPSLKR